MTSTDPSVDVLVLVASAGGLGAISAVLRTLPADPPVAIVVAQHLGGHGSALVDILGRRVDVPVRWAADGDVLVRGEVRVAPPRSVLEVLPDGALSVSPLRKPYEPLDILLSSLADSFANRVAAVVLSGMGRDGAVGAKAVRDAGGIVLAQSPDSAEHAGMPAAAIAAGATDLVVDLYDIGPLLLDVVRGGVRPRDSGDRSAAALFDLPGEVAALLRTIDWYRTTLGPVATWPAVLVSTLRTALECPVGLCVLWGPDQLQFYNDAYRQIMGDRHPAGLGQSNRECWPEVWHLNQPRYARVMNGEAVALKDALYPITRDGVLRDCWFDLTFSPIRRDDRRVEGVLATVIETTTEVLSRRRLTTLDALAVAVGGAETSSAALERTLRALAAHDADIPFSVGYVVDRARTRVDLVGAVGTPPGGPLAPHTLNLDADRPPWPIDQVVSGGSPVRLNDLGSRFRGAVVGRLGRHPETALVCPLGGIDDDRPIGVLVLGLNPSLPEDSIYLDFLHLVAAHTGAALTEAAIRERQQGRIDQLAELDRVRSEFLSNISDEFRTPLTLLLAPLEELSSPDVDLPEPQRVAVEAAQRNARRLLTMVESLLDFSQIEAGRIEGRLEPTDLARLTTEVADAFRGAIERAGIQFTVDCPTLPTPVAVDTTMWEKIVANLLSNALKFTFEGEIRLGLRELPHHVELSVEDSGVGIPEDQLANIFQRFHRVLGVRARTHEGAGIGLALVDELVRQHNGRVRVQSTEGKGSRFTVWIPTRRAAGARPTTEHKSRHPVAGALAEIAGFWGVAPTVPRTPDVPVGPGLGADGHRARVLVVDDNSDMRSYLSRLLSAFWDVDLAGDGDQALDRVRQRPPDLVLADVMTPNVDGLRLFRQLRAESVLRGVPMILLSARAGEQAAIDGLAAGASDFLSKPFAGRELVARVAAQLQLAQVRSDADRRFRALIEASFDVVYRMNPDWTELRALDGRGFIADADEPTSTWLDTYVRPEDQPLVLAAIERAVTSRGVFELEHNVVRADGTLGRTLSRAVPLFADDGEIVEWVGTAVDLTA
ncbi:chemotaxis protein CheB [Cryptosporangium phraense]|uniref:histidine kinase n=1 Tax=Cryptosporangium phraense TaxID=2593070 RepID=A0A545AGN9_9ACTN|nr:chemotaxis protein CheB [Cryptosporangium phraense]TQS40430.1 response regulator [Cryptosporangium phraense]